MGRTFRFHDYRFSAKEFLADMKRDPEPNDWIFKYDGVPIVQYRTYNTSSSAKITLGRIKGTKFWVFMEWCEDIK